MMERRRRGRGRKGRFTFLKIGFWASISRPVHLREGSENLGIEIACM